MHQHVFLAPAAGGLSQPLLEDQGLDMTVLVKSCPAFAVQRSGTYKAKYYHQPL